jgi:hypothetical protein
MVTIVPSLIRVLFIDLVPETQLKNLTAENAEFAERRND